MLDMERVWVNIRFVGTVMWRGCWAQMRERVDEVPMAMEVWVTSLCLDASCDLSWQLAVKWTEIILEMGDSGQCLPCLHFYGRT